MRRCGAIVRVSTKKLADIQISSVDSQMLQIQAHIDYRNTMRDSEKDESWELIDTYDLTGISGKDSVRSPLFRTMINDIKTGRINTVICTALDRMSRNVRDFLGFFDFLNDVSASLVVIRQQIDTTTPSGRLLTTMLMALAEFEREMTAQRVKMNAYTRATNGLWNGGRPLLGYDLNPDHRNRGVLIPNESEAITVRRAFELYEQQGSFKGTAARLNAEGHRTKSFVTKSGRSFPESKFNDSSVKRLLENYSYIGLKEVNKQNRHKVQDILKEEDKTSLVEAAWDGIVDPDVFNRVQGMIEQNMRARRNVAEPVKHCNILLPVIRCGECGSSMDEDTSVKKKGKSKTSYYYYLCPNKDCALSRIPAITVENSVLDLIHQCVSDRDVIRRIVSQANDMIITKVPALERELTELKNRISKLGGDRQTLLQVIKDEGIKSPAYPVIIRDLESVSETILSLEKRCDELRRTIEVHRQELITEEECEQMLSELSDALSLLPPNKQKKLIEMTVKEVVCTSTELEVSLLITAIRYYMKLPTDLKKFATRGGWYARQDSNPEPSGP